MQSSLVYAFRSSQDLTNQKYHPIATTEPSGNAKKRQKKDHSDSSLKGKKAKDVDGEKGDGKKDKEKKDKGYIDDRSS